MKMQPESLLSKLGDKWQNLHGAAEGKMRSDINLGLSDQVRAKAAERYVRPALKNGSKRVSIVVKNMLEALRPDGFPENHIPQICTALQSRKFLREHGLRIESIEGPPSKMSTTVVIHYRIEKPAEPLLDLPETFAPTGPVDEDPKARIRRLAGSLKGLLKDDFAKFGGGEAFLRWVRDEEAQ